MSQNYTSVNTTKPSTDPWHKLTAGIQISILCSVFFISVTENVILFCISHTFLHRWLSERSKQKYLDTLRSPASNATNPLRTIHKRDPIDKQSLSQNATKKSGNLFCCGIVEEQDVQYTITGDEPSSGCASKSVGTVTRYYFGNLCITNLLLMLLAVPFTLSASVGTNEMSAQIWRNMPSTFRHHDNILLKYPLMISELTCTFIECVVSSLLMVSVLSLVQLTADRLIAICQPLHYARWMTRRKTVYCIISVWVITLSLFIIPHLSSLVQHIKVQNSITTPTTDIYRCFVLGQHDLEHDWELAVVYFTFIFVFPLLFITASYVKIYITVRKCLRHLRDYSLRCQSGISLTTVTNKPKSDPGKSTNSDQPAAPLARFQSSKLECSDENAQESRRRIVQSRVAKTAFIFVSSFFCLTAPFFILMMIGAVMGGHSTSRPKNYSLPQFSSDIDTERETTEIFSFISVWFLYINSVTTPALYCCYDGVLRRRIVALFSGLRRSYQSRTTVV